jgi:hypothetical protein
MNVSALWDVRLRPLPDNPHRGLLIHFFKVQNPADIPGITNDPLTTMGGTWALHSTLSTPT